MSFHFLGVLIEPKKYRIIWIFFETPPYRQISLNHKITRNCLNSMKTHFTKRFTQDIKTSSILSNYCKKMIFKSYIWRQKIHSKQIMLVNMTILLNCKLFQCPLSEFPIWTCSLTLYNCYALIFVYPVSDFCGPSGSYLITRRLRTETH